MRVLLDRTQWEIAKVGNAMTLTPPQTRCSIRGWIGVCYKCIGFLLKITQQVKPACMEMVGDMIEYGYEPDCQASRDSGSPWQADYSGRIATNYDDEQGDAAGFEVGKISWSRTENPFKIRATRVLGVTLRKWGEPSVLSRSIERDQRDWQSHIRKRSGNWWRPNIGYLPEICRPDTGRW